MKINIFKSVLSSVFTHLSHCNFDKARDIMRKEKELSTVVAYGEILTLIPNIIDAEQSYMEFNYLNNKHKLVLKLDNSLRYVYDSAIREIISVQESNDIPELNHILQEIIVFISVRTKLAEIYDSLHTLSSYNKHIRFQDIVTKLQSIIDEYLTSYSPTTMASIKTTLTLEVDSLNGLLNGQLYLQNWQVLLSVNSIDTAAKRLASWLKILQTKEAWRINFLRNNTFPEVYQWMVAFKSFLMDKFSLYFYSILRYEISSTDLKILCLRGNLDCINRFQNLCRRNTQDPNGVILIVFDSCGLKNWHGPVHFLTTNKTSADVSNNSYHIMLKHPEKLNQSCYRLATIKKVILENFSKLLHLDKVICAYVAKENSTYFVTNIEERISLVVYYECKKTEKETDIKSYMSEFASSLRCHRWFFNMKPTSRN